MTLVPSGATGVLLNLKVSKSCLYAESFGLMREQQSIFKVAFPCGRSSHHREGGIGSSQLLMMEMKWVLKV